MIAKDACAGAGVRAQARELERGVIDLQQLFAARRLEQEAALIAARSNLAAARVRANALSAAYQSSLVSTGASPSTRLLAMVAGAVTASSDRTSKTELLAFVGLLAGLIAGAALAGLYELRARRYPTQ